MANIRNTQDIIPKDVNCRIMEKIKQHRYMCRTQAWGKPCTSEYIPKFHANTTRDDVRNILIDANSQDKTNEKGYTMMTGIVLGCY